MNVSNIKVLVVDDELLIADYVSELLNEEGFISTKIAIDKEETLGLFESFSPDIVLMDINLEGHDEGIELAKHRNNGASLIYLTAQHDSATIKKALDTNPESYLTKPIKKADLVAAVHLAIRNKQQCFVLVKDGYETIKLPVADILYVKSDNIYIDIFTTGRKYVIRQTLEKFYRELKSTQFIRVHRSYLVNRSAISSATSKSVFINDIEIPLSRSVAASFDLFEV